MPKVNIARVFPSDVCSLSDCLTSENKFRIEFLSRRAADVGYSYLYWSEYVFACGVMVSFVAALNDSSGIGFPVRNSVIKIR